MTSPIGLKFLLWKNRNFSFQKNSIQICIFNCNNVISSETVWVKVLLSKGWIGSMGKKSTFIKRMDSCSQKLQYKHYNGKKQGKGVGLRIMNFQG